MASVMVRGSFRVITLSVILQHYLCQGGHILLISLPQFSHMFQHAAVGDELTKMGHRVSTAVAKTVPTEKVLKNTNISVITFNLPPSHVPMPFGKDVDNIMEDSANKSLYYLLDEMSKRSINYCDAMLSDEKFLDIVKNEKVDLVLLDGVPFTRCFALLPKKLGVPFVAETPVSETFLSGAPFWPVVEANAFAQLTPGAMSFFERLQSFVDMAIFNLFDIPMNGQWLIKKHLSNERASLCFRDLMSECLLWLYGTQNPILGYPGALMSNSILVGGLTTAPAKRLHENLELFMSSAQHGVILFSLGSILKSLPVIYVQNLLEAFSRLKQKVVMKVHDPANLRPSANVKLETWIPQNDVLGHFKTKLFISHCGANSLYEALYHGVPLLGLPITPTDQPLNARAIENRGFGLWLDLKTITPDDVVKAITTILDDPTYAENMKRASTAFKSMPMTPRKTAAFWIDYVMKNGGEYLRPVSLDMPGWKSAMIDIAAFLMGCFLLTFLAVYWCLKTTYSKIARSRFKLAEVKKKN